MHFRSGGEQVLLFFTNYKGEFKNCTILTYRCRILLVLWWLWKKPEYSTIGKVFGDISKSNISREIHHIVPMIYSVLDEIHWDLRSLVVGSFEGTVGSIDCSSHFRFRVHPRAVEWYRGDKHAFFITSQVICDLTGVLRHVTLGKGHNNDRGFYFILTYKECLTEVE